MGPLAPVFDDHRAHLAALRAAAVAAADPAQAVRRWLRADDLAGAERVYLIGVGKAAVGMLLAAADVVGRRLTAGVAAVPRLPEAAELSSRARDGVAARVAERVSFIEGGHPEPTAGSLTAGRAVEALLSQVTARDLVIVLVSGGGSAMLELPRAGITLAHLKATTAALLRSGAPIQDFNAVRTRLSQLKGGGLARLAQPARVLGLILSDVVGSPLEAIASGPTVLGALDSGAALAVLERYGLAHQLPAAVLRSLQHGTAGLPDRAGAPAGAPTGEVPRVENRLIGSNRMAAEAAVAAAARLGFASELLGDDWQGEARLVGRRFARQLLAATAQRPPAAERPASARPSAGGQHPTAERLAVPLCLVAGGESTVSLHGRGRGGRNQEAALAAALAIDGQPGLVIGTFATDGVDGPTDAAGATVTGDTLPRARALNLDAEHYLNDNDSYNFFAQAGGLLITGPTGTNVNDLMFGLAY